MSVSLESFVSIDHFLLSMTTIYKKWNRDRPIFLGIIIWKGFSRVAKMNKNFSDGIL